MNIGKFFRGVRKMSERGFTLEATFLVMMLISVLVVIAFAGAVSTVRTANLDYRNARVQYASEAAAEDVMAQIHKAIQDGVLTNEDLAAITPPVVPGFTVDSFSFRKLGPAVKQTITEGSFAGLYALTQNAEIYASAADAIGNRSAVAVGLKTQSIPLFQFGVFFEKDLEFAPGKRQDIGGWVHSNGNIYASSEAPGLYFLGPVTTAKKYINDEKDVPDVKWNTFIKNELGDDVKLTFDSKTKPLAADFKAASNTAFNNRLRTDAYNVPTLRVPLPNGIEPIELLRPRDADDGEMEQASKFAWRADWYIKVPLNLLPAGGTTLCPMMISTRPAGKVVPDPNDCKNMFSWTWDAFFDARELRYVDVLQIDIDKLTKWGHKDVPDRSTQVLYVTFTGTPAGGLTDPQGDGYRPVVRLVNGKQIMSEAGLTIVTDRPLYVKGDYNSAPGAWVPAALVADANTVLSANWDDAKAVCKNYQKGKPTLSQTCTGYDVTKLVASATAVHAAILAGSKETPCYYADPGCPGSPDPSGDGSYYSGGGVADLLRVLEAWNKALLFYRGSFVSLHESVFGTGKWAQAYYTAPTRDWGYDLKFDDPDNLPPATPGVGTVVQTSFRPVY
jgi:type II secretory pathway pseudopilin PulG